MIREILGAVIGTLFLAAAWITDLFRRREA
jgi:hypothetical protein